MAILLRATNTCVPLMALPPDTSTVRVFGVMLQAADPAVVARLMERYPQHYKATDTFYLVASDELAQDIATTIGIRPDERAETSTVTPGVVFRLNGLYSGYFSRSLWEWLSNYE